MSHVVSGLLDAGLFSLFLYVVLVLPAKGLKRLIKKR